jgi:uncharacterized membrane protein YhaH (DUF805 family)
MPIAESIQERLKTLGALRDGAILSVTVVYVIGHITWMSYAWYHSLGLPAALDAQYFVIGLPVTALLVLVCIIAITAHKIIKRWHAIYYSQRLARQIMISIAVPIALLAIIATCALINETLGGLVALILGFFVLPVLFQLPGRQPPPLETHTFFYSMVALLLAGMLQWYVKDVYPSIPQAFGGGRPATRDYRACES